MKSDRIQTPAINLHDYSRRLTGIVRKEESCSVDQRDVLFFEQELEKSFSDKSNDSDSSPDDDPDPASKLKPFELIPSLSFLPTTPVSAVSFETLGHLFHACIQELYVSDEYASKRQVSMSFADNVLSGVTLSVYEEEGRIVGDFMCVEDTSWRRLCEASTSMVSELANTLVRDARLYVRHDSQEELVPLKVDAEVITDVSAPDLTRSSHD